MRKRTSLIARLNKLEQRKARKAWKRRVIFSIAEYSDSDVTGMTDSSGKVHLMRATDEPLAAFERRSVEVIPGQFLFHCYAAPTGCAELETGTDWHLRRAEA